MEEKRDTCELETGGRLYEGEQGRTVNEAVLELLSQEKLELEQSVMTHNSLGPGHSNCEFCWIRSNGENSARLPCVTEPMEEPDTDI